MCMTYLCIHSISFGELEVGDIFGVFRKIFISKLEKKGDTSHLCNPRGRHLNPPRALFWAIFFREIPASSASSKSFRRASHSCFQGPLPSHTAPATCELSKTENLGKPWCFRSLFWAAIWPKMQLEKEQEVAEAEFSALFAKKNIHNFACAFAKKFPQEISRNTRAYSVPLRFSQNVYIYIYRRTNS